MKFYIETKLLPNDEISIYFLWQKVYQQVHLGLVEIQNTDGNVAVSFPQYSEDLNHLGCKLRLFTEDRRTLEAFNIDMWLNRLTDYVHITKIRQVPVNISSHVLFKRQQVKSSKERIARRKAKYENIDYKQAIFQLEDFEEQRVNTPFINIKSQSTGKQFRLFIKKYTVENAQIGQFNSYGLSNLATVPWF